MGMVFSRGCSVGLTSCSPSSGPAVCVCAVCGQLSLCSFIATLLLDALLQRQMEPDAQLTLGEEFFIFKPVKGENRLETFPP